MSSALQQFLQDNHVDSLVKLHASFNNWHHITALKWKEELLQYSEGSWIEGINYITITAKILTLVLGIRAEKLKEQSLLTSQQYIQYVVTDSVNTLIVCCTQWQALKFFFLASFECDLSYYCVHRKWEEFTFDHYVSETEQCECNRFLMSILVLSHAYSARFLLSLLWRWILTCIHESISTMLYCIRTNSRSSHEMTTYSWTRIWCCIPWSK